jgi:hypothetical protein
MSTVLETPLKEQESALLDALQISPLSATRRSDRLFDVGIAYELRLPSGRGYPVSAWLPLVALNRAWTRMPRQLGGVIELFGGSPAREVAEDWSVVRDSPSDVIWLTFDAVMVQAGRWGLKAA